MADNEGAEKDLEIGDEQGDEVAGGVKRFDEKLDEATLDVMEQKQL